MPEKIKLYDSAYGRFAEDVQSKMRCEVYGEDLGQTSWMAADEFRRFLDLLEIKPGSQMLEVGSGAGGCALYAAETRDICVTGIDVNENGVRNARLLAERRGLQSKARFEQVDANKPLEFPDHSFDAVFSNDSICHLSDRAAALKEWHRVLKPGGRLLFSDAMILTGSLSNEEFAVRSSIGFYVVAPNGENERLISEAGFTLLRADDLTMSAETIAKKRHDSRERHRDDLIQIEGEENFRGVQNYLACVHTLAKERRLSRYAYLAQKP